MKTSSRPLKTAAILLIFGIAWPSSALALRTQQSRDNPVATAGLESSLQDLRLVMQHWVISAFGTYGGARFFLRPTDQALIVASDSRSDSSEIFKIPTKEFIPGPDFLRHLRLQEPRPVRFNSQGDRLYMFRKMYRDRQKSRSDMWGQKIYVLEWSSGKVQEIELRFDFEVKDFEPSPDGKNLYLLGFDEKSQQWVVRSLSLKTGKQSAKDYVLPFSPDTPDYSQDLPREFILSPDQKGFYLYFNRGTLGKNFMYFYDFGTRSISKPILSVERVSPIFRGNEVAVKTLAISPDNKVLYWGIPDNDPLHDQILVFDLESEQIQISAKIPGRLISLDVNPDGTLTVLTGFVGSKSRQGQNFELVHVYQGDLRTGPDSAKISGPRALITDASKAGLEETIFDETISGDDLGSGKVDVDHLWESSERTLVRFRETLWQKVWRSDPVWSRFSEVVIIPIIMDERYETFDISDYLEYFVLRHLVHNAIDAVMLRWAKSSQRLEIRIRALREGKNLRVQVLDNGEGISPEVLSVVGKKKITTKNVKQKVSGRTLGWQGEGLWAAFGVAENRGWRLTIENRSETQGVVASVVIPLHSGLEETVASRLRTLTATMSEKQLLVINAWVVEQKGWLEQLIRQAPKEFRDKLVLYGKSPEIHALAEYAYIPMVFSDDPMELVFELNDRAQEAGALQVSYLGDSITVDQLRLVLPSSVQVDAVPVAGLRELFLALGVSTDLLDSVRIEELQEELSRQRAA